MPSVIFHLTCECLFFLPLCATGFLFSLFYPIFYFLKKDLYCRCSTNLGDQYFERVLVIPLLCLNSWLGVKNNHLIPVLSISKCGLHCVNISALLGVSLCYESLSDSFHSLWSLLLLMHLVAIIFALHESCI